MVYTIVESTGVSCDFDDFTEAYNTMENIVISTFDEMSILYNCYIDIRNDKISIIGMERDRFLIYDRILYEVYIETTDTKPIEWSSDLTLPGVTWSN
jgi:hypothetical protein